MSDSNSHVQAVKRGRLIALAAALICGIVFSDSIALRFGILQNLSFNHYLAHMAGPDIDNNIQSLGKMFGISFALFLVACVVLKYYTANRR